jgi:hypothetical protein
MVHIFSAEYVRYGSGTDPVRVGLRKAVQGSVETLRSLLCPEDGDILGKVLIQHTPDLLRGERGGRQKSCGLAGGMDARLRARGAEKLNLFSGHPAEGAFDPAGNGIGRRFDSRMLPALIAGPVVFQGQSDVLHGIGPPFIPSGFGRCA